MALILLTLAVVIVWFYWAWLDMAGEFRDPCGVGFNMRGHVCPACFEEH